jgi:anti-sigma regulatory factor (Ser/Thr protein kinase)
VRPAAASSTQLAGAAQASAVVAEELSEGGLGIAIIEALADEFEIRERAEGGSSLRFVKHLS